MGDSVVLKEKRFSIKTPLPGTKNTVPDKTNYFLALFHPGTDKGGTQGREGVEGPPSPSPHFPYPRGPDSEGSHTVETLN